MNSPPIQKVLILGAGSAGLMSALAIKIRNPSLEVLIVRSPEIGIIRVGEGSFPHLPKFLHGYLGINPTDFYREVRPTWKLGIRYLWGPRPEGFQYTFRTQFDSRFQMLSKPTGYYCEPGIGYPDVATAMMENDRAVLHDEKGTPLIDRDHAYHVENHEFVTFLEDYARKAGVQFHDDEVTEVFTGDEGIAGLRLASGRKETAGLYVDCSGFRSLLVGSHLGASFRSYESSLFCDKAITGGWKRGSEVLKPYTTAETMEAGWCWQIEHHNRINRGYVFSSSFLSEDEAEAEFRRKNPALEDTRVVSFRSGILENPWTGNAVAVGNASGFVEPLEATALGQIAQDAQSIAEILADNGHRISRTMAAQHNVRFRRSWDNIRQFLAIHYRFNRRIDSEFWRAALNDVDISGAEEFVEYYRENGPSTLFRPTLIDRFDQFNLDGYLAMMIGQQVPHENRYEPPEPERQIWRRINESNRRKAMQSYDCAKGLEIVGSPRWNWNPEFFRNAWTEIKTV